jgi:hypothetical protein
MPIAVRTRSVEALGDRAGGVRGVALDAPRVHAERFHCGGRLAAETVVPEPAGRSRPGLRGARFRSLPRVFPPGLAPV